MGKRHCSFGFLEKKTGLIFLLSVFLSGVLFAQPSSPFRVNTPTPSVAIQPGETKSIQIQIEIPAKFFVYQDKTVLKFLDPKGLEVTHIQYPSSRERKDIYFKKAVKVFENLSPVTVSFKAPEGLQPGRREIEGLLTLQGCSDVLCYPEESHLLTFDFDVQNGAVVSSAPPEKKLSEWLAVQDFRRLMEQNWWIILTVVFLGGFLTSLTPCVLPVIPITLMIIGVRSDRHWSHNFCLSAVLVLGLALMYAALGVLAVSLGKSLGFVFQQKGFVILLSILFFIFALSMFGLFEIHLPQRLRQRLNRIEGHGFWGAFASGMAAGILAAPCAGPVIGALLLYVATTQSYGQGFGLLLLYSLGMGLLFIVLGTGFGTLEARIKSHRWTVWIKRFLGVLLILGSLFYLNSVVSIPKILFQSSSIGIWIPSEPQGLALAKKENKVMLLDFYADWCAPCKELEIGFFRKKEVEGLLKQMVPVRIDATFVGNPDVERVIKKYKVIGWPTILFVGPDGKVLDGLTVISYRPELLLENMKRAVGQ